MHILLMLELLCLWDVLGDVCIILLCHLFSPFHQLYAKREAKRYTDEIIKPNVEPAWLNILVCILLPAIVMSQFVFGDLVNDFGIPWGINLFCQPLINMVLGDFRLLKA